MRIVSSVRSPLGPIGGLDHCEHEYLWDWGIRESI